jgi:hypothetical protein
MSVRAGRILQIHGNEGKKYVTAAQYASRCRAFFRWYYPMVGQVLKDREITLPHGTKLKLIYNHTFLAWWARQKFDYDDGRTVPPPSLSTFSTQGHHPDFGHVKRAAKHHHLRCTICAGLKDKQMYGLADGEDIAQYRAALAAHHQDVRAWRDAEAYYTTLSTQDPKSTHTIMADDTSKIGFPHFTNRPQKAIATNPTVDFVPWLFESYASNEKVYVYSLKNKFKKVAFVFARFDCHSLVLAGREPVLHDDDSHHSIFEGARGHRRSRTAGPFLRCSRL